MNEWRSRAFLLIRCVLGMLLLAAAALKIYGWSVSSVPPVGWFSGAEIQTTAIGWEIFLGAWLLCGIATLGSWFAAICTFTFLAGLSSYLGWVGQATCNCFGTIKASPWEAFALDVTALALLALGRPNWQSMVVTQHGELWRRISFAGNFLMLVGVMVAFFACVALLTYGSPQAALARLGGASLTIIPSYVDFGTGRSGDILEAEVKVRNWTNRPVRIIGGTSDCSCVTTLDLPMTLQPSESRIVRVKLKVPKSQAGLYTRMAGLWTDNNNQRTIGFRVGCEVR